MMYPVSSIEHPVSLLLISKGTNSNILQKKRTFDWQYYNKIGNHNIKIKLFLDFLIDFKNIFVKFKDYVNSFLIKKLKGNFMRPVFKGNFAHIIFLVSLLVGILAIMIYLKSGKSSFMTREIPEFEEQVKVIDNKYYNKIYNFSVSMPNADWEMVCVEKIDSLRKQDTSLPILDNITVMLEMYRRDMTDTLAIVQVGIIQLFEPRTPQSLAEQNLSEIKLSFPPPDTVRVIKDVTLSGSGRLKGAYYVIEFDESLNYAYPVWVAMFIVYNKLAYSMICQVSSEDYAFLRTDFETILTSFRLFKT
ncbi:MAG: hypothetical protein JSW07_21760 [bacterium]|nr:MAG: hypothetical protein JSW07_21760 [bacterium]